MGGLGRRRLQVQVNLLENPEPLTLGIDGSHLGNPHGILGQHQASQEGCFVKQLRESRTFEALPSHQKKGDRGERGSPTPSSEHRFRTGDTPKQGISTHVSHGAATAQSCSGLCLNIFSTAGHFLTILARGHSVIPSSPSFTEYNSLLRHQTLISN